MLVKLALFLSLLFVFFQAGAMQVALELSQDEINIWDNVTLRIKVADNANLDIWHIEIEWLDKFQVLWTSKSSQTQMINREIISTLQYDFKITTNYTWNITIWPAIIERWDSVIKSNVVTLKVNSLVLNNLDDKQLNIDLIIAILFLVLILTWFWFLFLKYLDEKNRLQKNLEKQNDLLIEKTLKSEKFLNKINSYDSEEISLDDLKDIVLAYINVFYSKNLKSLTTLEIINKLYDVDMDESKREKIKIILNEIDTSKYSWKNIDLNDIFFKIKELINN